MQIISLNTYTTVYNFDEIDNFETCVVLIEKPNRFYLIDTYCGPDSMEAIVEIMNAKPHKEMVVINTHYHWDHIWGNCAFPNAQIVAHRLTLERMNQSFDEQLKKNSIYKQGDVQKVLPSSIFDDRMTFPDDGIEVFYSPGHTNDSISVYDIDSSTLYVGDNLERPLIYVEDKDIEQYIKTLNHYKNISVKKIVGSHTISLTDKDIQSTIDYLIGLKKNEPMQFSDEGARELHEMNVAFIHGK